MPKTSRDDEAFQQPSLLEAADLFPGRPAETPKPRLRRRPRVLDEPVLQFIGYFGVVTTYQVLYHFFVYRGKRPRYGWRVLRHLESEGLAHAFPIDRELGSAALRAWRLTEAGARKVGLPSPSANSRARGRDVLRHELQYAETVVERWAQGWKLVRPDAAFDAIRRWALARYAGRALNAYEREERSQIERLPAVRIPVPVIVRPTTADLRLLLPVRADTSLPRLLGRLPSFGLLPPPQFELVVDQDALLARSLETLVRFSTRKKFEFAAYKVPPFDQRRDPRDAEVGAVPADGLALPLPVVRSPFGRG